MKTKLIILLLCISGKILSQPNLNLDFEYAGTDLQKPAGWFTGAPGYIAVLDSAIRQNGLRSLRIESNTPGENQFGVCTGTFPVDSVKGKDIEFSGWIKTKDVTGGFAGLWWRVDGPSDMLGFDNMYDRGISGTTDWVKVSIKMKIDPQAININYGGLFIGLGTAWFDDFEVLINGRKFVQAAPAGLKQ